ncbi:MAG: DinB family protein [Candidatus Eisenbacteria bacterium]
MAPRVDRNILRVPRRGRSAEVMTFLGQFDDLSRRQFGDLESCSVPELAWQPRRGANTIGMLLAHNAVVEVYWMLVATESFTPERFEEILGIGLDDDGIPMPPDGLPPAHLRRRTIAWYRALHDRARAFTSGVMRRLTTADLDRVVRRRMRRKNSFHECNLRWLLYHVLEHQAGHYGQSLLLRHLYADRRKRT